MIKYLLISIIGLYGCEYKTDQQIQEEYEQKLYNGPCSDTSAIIATTVGSPSQFQCPNKHHKMHIQIASAPSKEEFGAVAFCECQDKVDSGIK